MADTILATPPAPAAGTGAPAAAPASGAAQPGGPPASTGATPSADWLAPFDEDVRSAIAAKGYKGVSDLGRGWLAASKLVGVDPSQIVKLPGKDADAAAWDAVYARLGRPEKPEGYSLPDALAKDPVAAEFRTAAHAAGLTPKQAEGLLAWYTGTTDKLGGQMAEQAQAAQTKRLDALQREVGPQAWPAFIEEAQRAGRALVPERHKDPATGAEMTREQILVKLDQALGTDLAVRILQGAAKFTVSEDRTERGSPAASGIMSVEAAKARKAELRGDKAFMKRWIDGDTDARKEMVKLDTILAGAA